MAAGTYPAFPEPLDVDPALPPMAQAVDRACKIARGPGGTGTGQSALARLLKKRSGRNVTQSNVWTWINKTHRMPPELVLDVEAVTGVSRHQLRPDVFGEKPSPSPEEADGRDAA